VGRSRGRGRGGDDWERRRIGSDYFLYVFGMQFCVYLLPE